LLPDEIGQEQVNFQTPMNIHAYLTFNGDCREAMTFYQQCLGGELHFQTLGDSPAGAKMPLQMKNNILHSTLQLREMALMASDIVFENGLVVGNSVSLLLNCNNEEEIKLCYERLSKGGEQTHPIEFTFWGSLFGGLTDKFGNHWLLNYQKQQKL